MRVDSTNNTPNGRPSVRITSNKVYQAGSLIILDADHMPGGICGTWPAFWLVGPNWPNEGEIGELCSKLCYYQYLADNGQILLRV